MPPSPVPFAARMSEPVLSTSRPQPGGLMISRRPKPGGVLEAHRPRPAGRHSLETVARRARPWRLAGSLD